MQYRVLSLELIVQETQQCWKWAFVLQVHKQLIVCTSKLISSQKLISCDEVCIVKLFFSAWQPDLLVYSYIVSCNNNKRVKHNISDSILLSHFWLLLLAADCMATLLISSRDLIFWSSLIRIDHCQNIFFQTFGKVDLPMFLTTKVLCCVCIIIMVTIMLVC